MSLPRARRHLLLVAAGGALAAASLSGCGSGGGASRADTDASPGRPVLSHRTTTGGAATQTPQPAPWRMPSVPDGETLGARVVRTTALRRSPGGTIVTRLGTRTRFGSRQTLAVVSGHDGWVQVRSAALQNGETGWVSADDVTFLRETWTIDVDLSERELVLRHQGEVRARMTVGVGAPGTDTPPGVYGVTDRLTTHAGSPYGCCILGLTGRQPNIPQGWAGGDHIALHGTSDPASVGRAVSHGCIRLGDADVRLLMARVPLGTRVRITA